MRRDITRCPHGRQLVCTKRHAEDDPRLGRPICLDCYDHAAHVVWNGWAGELWRRTIITLTRALRRLERAHDIRLRVSYGKVAEYQRRGVVHFHALIRLDRIDPADPDAVLAPPADITAAELVQLVTDAVTATRFLTPGYADTGHCLAHRMGPTTRRPPRHPHRPRRHARTCPPTRWPPTWPSTPPRPPNPPASRSPAG